MGRGELGLRELQIHADARGARPCSHSANKKNLLGGKKKPEILRRML